MGKGKYFISPPRPVLTSAYQGQTGFLGSVAQTSFRDIRGVALIYYCSALFERNLFSA